MTIVSDGEFGGTREHIILATSVRGMGHLIRYMHPAVGVELYTAIRVATLTPAKILGIDHAIGKRADWVLLSNQLAVRRVGLNHPPVG